MGEGGYQVGNFPSLWSEWNGKYRDCVRDFWREENQKLGEFASRFTGSSDLYRSNSRLPSASINYITSHDGFTLNDLVSYNVKHNEPNWNLDGDDNNRSWNCGKEGDSEDPNVTNLRNKQKRNFLATLFLSQGVPMLMSGDEMGRTQKGNNNSYCQDNEISWQNWESIDKDLFEFTKKLINYRTIHPVFKRRRWFEGRPIHDSKLHDIEWFTMDGKSMVSEDWGKGFIKSIGIFLNGKTIPNPNPRAEPVTDDDFYIIFNASEKDLNFRLPSNQWCEQWIKELDTSIGWLEKEQVLKAEETLQIQAHSLVVLRHGS